MKRIKVLKGERRLDFFENDVCTRSFRISLGFVPEGDKIRDGDGRTPEGSYYICTKNPYSKFTLFLGISYPNAEDARRGFDEGLITKEELDAITKFIANGKRPSWETALGGKIGIHGRGASRDWTAGCIAMEDEDVKWLWDHTELGDPVEICK